MEPSPPPEIEHAAAAARLREIPYNYTSFSDREIVIRLLGAERLGSARRAARASAAPAARRACSTRCWATSGWCTRNPYLQDDLLDNPKRRAAAGRGACATACARSRSAAATGRARRRQVAQLLDARRARAVRRASRTQFADDRARCARKVLRAPARASRAATTSTSTASRASRTSPTPPTGASRYPFVVRQSRHRGGDARRSCATLHRARASPSSRAAAAPATPAARSRSTRRSAVINTEKLDALGGVETMRAARAWREPCPTIRCGAGVVTKRVMEAAEDARAGVRGRPDLGRRLVHRRQRRDERRRQEGGAVGHGARQPRLVAHGRRPTADWLEVERLDHNLGKIHDVAARALPHPPLRGRRQHAAGRARSSRSRAAASARTGLGKDVTDKFLAGLPGVQKEGCDGLITSARFILHRMPPHDAHRVPGVLRPGARRGAGHRRDQGLRRRAPDGDRSPGLEHLDERYVKAVGYATKAQAPRAAEDGADRRHRRRRRGRGGARPPRRWCASPTRAAARASSRSRAEARKKLLARPRAHRGHRQAHQRLQDQRGRGDPAGAPGRLLRRHRAHQHRAVDRQQAEARSTRWTSSSRASCRCTARREARPRGAARRPPGAGAARWSTRRASAGAACSTISTCRRPRRRAELECPALDAAIDAAPSHAVHAAAGPRAARVVEDGSARARCEQLFDGRDFAAGRRRHRGDPPARAARAACSSRCTCTPATATCTPTSRSTPTTTRCCRRPTRRWRASCSSRASLGGVISGEHGIGITKLEFLEPRRARGVPRLQGRGRSRGPLQPRQAAAGRATSPTPTRRPSPARRRVAHPRADARSAASPTRSRTACAAASASRCARPTCRAPTCSTARATRSSPPRC